MGISLRDLKAKKILKVIGEGENQIQIYNINCKENQDRRIAIFDYITQAYQDKIDMLTNNPSDTEIEIIGMDIINYVLPILTDIDFNGITDDEVQDILQNPTKELNEVINICGDILVQIANEIEKAIEIRLKTSQIQNKVTKISKQNDTKRNKLLADWKKIEEERKAQNQNNQLGTVEEFKEKQLDESSEKDEEDLAKQAELLAKQIEIAELKAKLKELESKL